MSNTTAGEPGNHYHLADRRTLQSESLISHLPHSNQQQQCHNHNTQLNDQETASIKQLKPVISKTSHLASMMVEQLIIQAAISSIETFYSTKGKFEFWMPSVENAAKF